MSVTMINPVNSREYNDLLIHYNDVVNVELIDFAKYYYRESLDRDKIKEICSMSLDDKLWLLAQYKEELASASPDLDNLY
jgi:hypothetical protein